MTKTIGEDFAEDVKINRMKMEEECAFQPEVYYYYSSQLADARAGKDAAKDRLDLILGQREIAIRRNPPDDMKVTESVITALVIQDTEVQSAKEDYRKACEKTDILYAAVAALDHRKSQLDNLVQLWTKNYYSGIKDDASVDMRERLNKKGE